MPTPKLIIISRLCLSNKTFSAQQWFQKENASLKKEHQDNRSIRNRFPSFVQIPKKARVGIEPGDRFSPFHCFTPGWTGDSLISKNIHKFELLLLEVQQDVKTELLKSKDFPRTIKIGLYNEFLSYAESLGLHFNGLDDMGNFWALLDADKIQEDEKILEFVNIYSYRVAQITFLKLRFIGHLTDSSGLILNDKALLYPTSFLSQIFKKGSMTELHSRALETNLYSWYRPHEGMKRAMKELLSLSKDLSLTEINKFSSQKTQIVQDQSKVYSHALSHLSMGLFLNSLQINFPLWLETVEGTSLPLGQVEDEQIISCKYFGDYLESLSLSHWLAQENNKTMRWNEILCPDFKGLEFTNGTFSKICNELQFLSFLVQKAEHQQRKPVEWICKVMGSHYRNRKEAKERQGFLLDENPFFTSTYDRVVLNLCHFPKNNPQHFLMNQISEQLKFLKPNGYLFVLSSKKLFVPSLGDRLEPLLQELKTEAIFDLENVKGKGELGSYIYVFRKKNQRTDDKQLCSYFRMSFDLNNFQEFISITEHLRSFYLSHLEEAPSMTQMDFGDNFRLEYFQEAIVKGMVIHSTSEDSSRITHPSFFKSLLNSCSPLESFFEIKPLSLNENPRSDLGLDLNLKKDLAYFLVVDFRTPEVKLELHPMDTFRSILSDYGQTHCSYFQLQPKISGLNPNILRNYFVTAVGKQVINITFTGGQSMVKGSLKKLLIPKLLTETEILPEHLMVAFTTLEISEEELLGSSAKDVLKSFKHVDQISRDLFPRYACEILSRLSRFERTLQNLIWKMDDSRLGQKMSFNNPLIQAQLVQKPTAAIYPDNAEVYIEFVENTSPSDIHLPLTDVQMRVSHEGDLKLFFMELISENKTIVRFHAEEGLIQFINYILSHARNVPISKLLKAVHVPSVADLKTIVHSSQEQKVLYQELQTLVDSSIKDAFRLHVVSKR
jgi:hypothetical protein